MSIPDQQDKNIFYYINDSFIEAGSATVHVLDLGLLRGYGIFDYVQVYEGVPFHLIEHLKRLSNSGKRVGIELPFSHEEMIELTTQFIEKNKMVNGGIRFVVTGGGASNDLILPGGKASFMIIYHEFSPYPKHFYEKGMRVITTDMLRLLPSVKTTNYLPAIFALQKAKKLGFDDALYVNDANEILEGTTCNAFFFKNGKWITSSSSDIIQGVTRDVFLKLIQKEYPIEYRSLPLEEVATCEEAFLCSSVKDAMPLVQINDTLIGKGAPGHHTAALRSTFNNYVKNYVEAFQKD